MQITIRSDSVEITGYVNAVERLSKPLRTRMGQFMELIRAGAFKRALERNNNIRLLMNHDKTRDLGGTKEGNLVLKEDNIGLKARAVITDAEAVEKARKGELVGWSFGFIDRGVSQRELNGVPVREVDDLDLREVSILDNTRIPAYAGTLIEIRADGETEYYGDIMTFEDYTVNKDDKDDPETRATSDDDTQEPQEPQEPEETKIDYSKYERIIEELKGAKNA